jgi:chaperone modulatory protein CbpM
MAEKQHLPVLAAAHVDDQPRLTLGELCRVCGVHAEWVFDLVAEGILEPAGRRPSEWRFSGTGLRRAYIARRLQHDLNVNMAGVALALELLEEMKDLRTRLRMAEPEPLDPDK